MGGGRGGCAQGFANVHEDHDADSDLDDLNVEATADEVNLLTCYLVLTCCLERSVLVKV